MPQIRLTRELAYAASVDAANRSMRSNDQITWNEEDAETARGEFNRLWPTCNHKLEPGECLECEYPMLYASKSRNLSTPDILLNNSKEIPLRIYERRYP